MPEASYFKSPTATATATATATPATATATTKKSSLLHQAFTMERYLSQVGPVTSQATVATLLPLPFAGYQSPPTIGGVAATSRQS